MKENPFIQEILKEAREDAMASGIKRGLERGLERGQKKCAIDLILDMLNEQFPDDEVHELEPVLEEIDELERLKQLHRRVSKGQSYEEFKQELEN